MKNSEEPHSSFPRQRESMPACSTLGQPWMPASAGMTPFCRPLALPAQHTAPSSPALTGRDGIVFEQPVAALLILLAAFVALLPVLRNGFLVIAFDDDAFVLDNPYLRGPFWQNAWACLSHFYAYDYLPLPMLSYLIEFRLWGLSPVGYHVTNLVLHALNALLVYAVVGRACANRRAALFAALIFAVHPLQVEATSLIAQRKSLLATAFLLGALWAYQASAHRGRSAYVLAVFLYLAACGSKSTVVPFPFLLLVYDFTFQRDRLSIRNKLPFLALSLIAVWCNLASKVGSEVVKAPQGGNYLVSAIAMCRVAWEYVDAMLLPFNLSPSYYYSRHEVFSVTNCAAAMTLVAALALLIRWRARIPLTFFFVAWVGLSLLPVANIVPIAILRADRYLYLPMVGFALWAGSGFARLSQRADSRAGWQQRAPALAPWAVMAILAVLTARHAAVYHDDVAAWTRVVERNPWSAQAQYMLGLAYLEHGPLQSARRVAATAAAMDPTFEAPRELLARIALRERELGQHVTGTEPPGTDQHGQTAAD